MSCACPPCEPIDGRIIVCATYPGPTPTSVIVQYCLVDGSSQPLTGYNITWNVIGATFTQINDTTIQVQYDVTQTVIVQAQVQDKKYLYCVSLLTYIPDCDFPNVTFQYGGNCDTETVDIVACLDGDCTANPVWIYAWVMPGNSGYTVIQPNHIQLGMSQQLPTCDTLYELVLFNRQNACRLRVPFHQNICNYTVEDYCSSPVLNTPLALFTYC